MRTPIFGLTRVSATDVTGSDLLPVGHDGDSRALSLTDFVSYLKRVFASPDFRTQVEVSGTFVILGEATSNVWLLINPPSAVAAMTVQLPPSTSVYDGQTIMVSSLVAIDALTIDPQGIAVIGAPTAMAANAMFALRYNKTINKWVLTAMSNGAVTTFGSIEVDGTLSVTGTTTLQDVITTGVKDLNSNELLSVSATDDAVNHVQLANAATGTGPTLSAVGDDANVDLNLAPKVTGKVKASGAEVVTLSATQTLTNKTLTGPLCDAVKMGGVGSSTVALLNVIYPPATSKGFRTTVVDSNAALAAGLGNVVAGGGAICVPVYCDGAAWRIG